MAIEPVKIPQNVYIEDRVIGPITLKQIIIMTLGGGFSYMIFTIIQKAVGTMTIPLAIIAWTPAAIAAAFALIKINDLSLMRIVFLVIEKSQKSPVRTWAPRQGLSVNIRFGGKTNDDGKAHKQAVEKQKAQRTQERIRELSTFIDKPIDTLEDEPVEAIEAMAVDQIPVETPVAERVADADPVVDEKTDRPTLPVNPARVKVDGVAPGALQAPQLSDLSVFRDVFSPKKP